MVQMHFEVEGDVDEVVRFLGHLGVRGSETVRGPDGRQIAATEQYREEDDPVSEPAPAASTPAPLSGGWTEELAADFMVDLDPVARLMTLHVWRAGAASIHRSALCQRTELTPVELGSLVIQIGHVLRRFQRERGMALSRPMAANSPLQSYFVDPEFAAVASDLFGERMLDQMSGGLRRP